MRDLPAYAPSRFPAVDDGLGAVDEAAIDLPAMGSDGTTFSNGRQTLTIVQGRVSWGVGRAAPTSCTGG
jgi:hypothetical protein